MNVNQNMKELLTRGFLHQKEVGALSALLHGEISAVEAYNLAIEKIKDTELIATLVECRNSHAIRIAVLQGRLETLDENPLESSGWWGVVARFVEGSATMISDKVAMSVLAAGEDYGFSQYELHMKDLDAESFAIAERQLLPAQGMTLQTMSLLCAVLRSQAQSTTAERKADGEKENSSRSAA